MTNAEALFSKSLRPEGSLGRTAQDVHLDSHTASELWVPPCIALLLCMCSANRGFSRCLVLIRDRDHNYLMYVLKCSHSTCSTYTLWPTTHRFIMSDFPLAVTISSKPTIEHTLDDKQKTFRCFESETLFKWRAALALRYARLFVTSPYNILWEDRDCDGDLLADNVPLSTLWKTFVQIYKDEKKCLSITLYFIKKPTRKKGVGTCQIQGNQCLEWVQGEFQILSYIVKGLIDQGTDPNNLVSEYPALECNMPD